MQKLSILCILICYPLLCLQLFFFFNDTATTEIYTLSLHDALPIYGTGYIARMTRASMVEVMTQQYIRTARLDRKSTRLNSSHVSISYAVFCLKKKKNTLFGCSFRKNKETLALIV